MTTVPQVMKELKSKGKEQTRKTYARHNAPEDMYGVSVADMKLIAKKLQGQHELALELFKTGNADAMYLAGMVADGTKMNKTQLQAWAKGSPWQMISEYAVPWVATESPHARPLAMKWIKSKKESLASTGWCTYGGIVATTPDEELDLDEIRGLLDDIAAKIDQAPNRVKYTMNGFVITVGAYVKPLSKKAKSVAKKLGKVSVDMQGTACKVPVALDYIEKMEAASLIGKKRKTVRC